MTGTPPATPYRVGNKQPRNIYDDREYDDRNGVTGRWLAVAGTDHDATLIVDALNLWATVDDADGTVYPTTYRYNVDPGRRRNIYDTTGTDLEQPSDLGRWLATAGTIHDALIIAIALNYDDLSNYDLETEPDPE